MKKYFLIITFLFAVSLLAGAKSPVKGVKKEVAQRTYTTKLVQDKVPVIDGKGDDPAWQQVEWSGDFIQREPHEDSLPTQKTAFKILYDENNVYVLIRAYDTEPNKIVTRMARRDDQQGDYVGVAIDSYFDKLSAFAFFVSAAGVKSDGIVTNDNTDFTWDPVWYAKTSIDKEGWIAEMRIPLDQLRFSGQNEHVWGLEVVRTLSRLQENSYWKQIPKASNGTVNMFGELRGINGIKPKRQKDIMPYVVAKTESYQPDPPDPYNKNGHSSNLGVGLDGKMGITNDFTLDFTINPDFGQVEADPSQVNLSSFETYFSEKRPFFIEGKDVMSFQLTMGNNQYSSDNLFYSRRIGRQPHYSPDGDYVKNEENTRILGAFKLSGKTKDGLSLGILESFTDKMFARTTTNGIEKKVEAEPYTNYFVGSVMKDYDKGNTRFGGEFTATNRDLSDPTLKNLLPSSAYTGGLRFEKNWENKKYTLMLSTEFSQVNGSVPAIKDLQESSVHYYQRPDAHYMKYDSTRNSLMGTGGSLVFLKGGEGHWKYLFWFNWRSPGLNLNDVGYLRKADDMFQVIWASYRLWKPTSIYRTLNFETNQWTGWDFGGRSTFKGGNMGVNSQLKNYWYVNLYMGYDGPNIDNYVLRGGPSLRLPGDIFYNYSINSDDRKKFVYGFSNAYNTGFNHSSHFADFGLDFSYRPADAVKITFSPGYQAGFNDMQYVTTESGKYIMARIDQKMFRTSFRFEYYPKANMSVQYYGQPFIFAAKYSKFKRVTNSMASDYNDRIHLYSTSELNLSGGIYTVFENGSNSSSLNFDNPDFKDFAFLSNLVFRWEYIPGSTVYLVWSQNRYDSDKVAQFNFGKDFSNIYKVYPHDIFMIKFSYRF